MGPWLGCSRWSGWLDCIRRGESLEHRRSNTRFWAPLNGGEGVLDDSLVVQHSGTEHDHEGMAPGGWRGNVWGKLRSRYGTRYRADRSPDEGVTRDGSGRDLDLPGYSDLARQPRKRTAYTVFAARLAIMVMLAILIGVLTILAWHITSEYTTKSVKMLAFNLRADILQRPLNRMWLTLNSTLDISVTYVNLAKYVIGQHTLPLSLSDQDEVYSVMRNISWALFASQKLLNALTLIYSNGVTQGFERDLVTLQQFYSYSAPAANESFLIGGSLPTAAQDFVSFASSDAFEWYKQPVDATGHLVDVPAATRPYNISQDFDGITLLNLSNEDVAWQVTVHRSSPAPFLATGSPVRHPISGEVIAIAGNIISLTKVNELMRQLVKVEGGSIYLTDSDGWLLASSTTSPMVKNTSTGPSLLRAEESSDPLIKSGAEWLRHSYGMMLSTLQNVHRENVVLLDEKYYVDVFILNLTKLTLVGVIITPRRFVMGEVDRRSHTTLAILISISACFLLLGCFCTLLLTRGVSNEMKLRAELINHLDARRRAEASSNYKSQFLANMSHELRTPMAAVIGLLDVLLCDEYLTSEQVAIVSQIRQCSTALLRLLNNILDLSKVESGKLVLEEADFDLRRELEVLVDMFSVQCTDRNIEIVLDIADDLPRLLKGDSARTVQVFANLIANSIKFTSSGHVLVRGRCDIDYGGRNILMTAGSAMSEGSGSLSHMGSFEDSYPLHQEKICVSFEVDDTGCGMDPSKWETIFDSFVQADTSTTRTYGGSGLGLCIVRSLVQQMGGDIKVVKKEGSGTLMKFHLYFKMSSEIPIPTTFKESCKSTFLLDKLQRSKLLFAMQGHTMRTTLSEWMRGWGVNVIEVGNLEATLAELEELVPLEPQGKSSPRLPTLAIIDIGIISNATDLDALGKYIQQGVTIGWVLNHDTSNTVKSDFRRRGFSVMANNPLYKSKLIQVLKMLAVGSSEEGDNGAFVGAPLTSKPERHRRSSFEEVRDGIAVPANLKSLRRYSLDAAMKQKSSLNSEYAVRRRSAGDYSIYKPTNYLQPELVGLGKRNPLVTDSISKVAEGDLRDLLNTSSTPEPGRETSRPELPDSDGLPDLRVKGSQKSYRDGPLAFSVGKQGLSKLQDAREQRTFPEGLSEKNRQGNVQESQEEMEVNELDRLPLRKIQTSSPSSSLYSGKGEDNVTHLRPILESVDSGNSILDYDKQQSSPPPPEKRTDDFRPMKPGTPPRIVPAPTRQARLSSTASSRFGSRDALKGIKILLAEDTQVLQRVATMMLERLGATVVPVGDGLQAVDALTERFRPEESSSDADMSATRRTKYRDPETVPFDVVLMDCQMPVLDGYEATKIIREAEKGTGCHIPIIALTAHAMLSDEAKCLDVGMDAFLTKPIDTKLMMSTIASFTGKTSKSPSS